jgi:hypothetical protein
MERMKLTEEQWKAREKKRFMAKIDWKAEGCWLWQGAIIGKPPNNYGVFRLSPQNGERGKRTLAHQYSYRLFRGPISDGLEIHHTCMNPLCVRPNHLRLVTHKGNMELMQKNRKWDTDRAKTHCLRGHEYTPQNTYISKQGWRSCLECRNTYRARHTDS